MKLIMLLPVVMLAGCLSTAPKFPDIPPELKAGCPELNEIPNGTQELSKVLDSVVVNYGTYYECRVRVDAWLEWHQRQRKIFDEAK